MNLQQLRIIHEAVRQDYNLTDVANALYTSQPGVSKHIRDIEDELGVEIFVRRGKRLLGLTDPGRELVDVVARILLDTQNLRRIAAHFSGKETGNFVIATTHTQARYVLPPVITRFRQDFPKVHLVLHQGNPQEIADMLSEGRADIGIATEGLSNQPELATFAGYDWQHAVVVPDGHPLTKVPRLTLETIASYPLITYHQGFTGRGNIDRRFAEAGVQTDIVLSAIDADVIKAYVETGLGVGIIAEMAFDPARQHGLTMLPTHDLFATNTTRLALRRGRFLRNYAYRFIEYFSPALTEDVINSRLNVELEPA